MAMPKLLEPTKTYACRENMDRAIKKLEDKGLVGPLDRYLVSFDFDGRLYPVFLFREGNSTFQPAVLAQMGFCSVC